MEKLKQGQKAPEFALNDTNGNKVNLADFKGKKLFYTFTQKMIHQDAQSRHAILGTILKN